jgi:hypothetical protein
MQKLPQIHIWKERIDANAWAFHAVRGWGDRPSNGVFMLVADTGHGWPYSQREEIIAELEGRLKRRESILSGWYGRDWRNHLCARIIVDPTHGASMVDRKGRYQVVDDYVAA